MTTEIIAKETLYSSFIVDEKITGQNFDKKYDTIVEKFGEGDSHCFDSETEFALNMVDFCNLPDITYLNPKQIHNQEIRFTKKNQILKSIRFHKDSFGNIQLQILDKKGNILQVITI